MRCPKCGYISFDRQRSCGKCSNDLTAAAEQITGTAGKATAPFFLAAVLGEKNPTHDAPSPPLYEEEESLSLDELDAETLPTDEEELDFSEVPLTEDDLEDQPLPSLGLEDIDVSDLIPPQEEKEEELELTLGSNQEDPPLNQEKEEEQEASLSGLEFSGFEFDDTLSATEKELPLGGFEDESRESQANEEEEEIIDLSSLMNFDDTPAQPTAEEEERDIMDLSLGEEPEELHLSLEEEGEPAPDDTAKKPASTLTDIPDLGLTLENDDR